jgi:hypothetical protein
MGAEVKRTITVHIECDMPLAEATLLATQSAERLLDDEKCTTHILVGRAGEHAVARRTPAGNLIVRVYR